MSRSY